MIDTIEVFDCLGFTMYYEKSQFTLTQEMTNLGFVINSRTVTEDKLLNARESLLKQTQETNQDSGIL